MKFSFRFFSAKIIPLFRRIQKRFGLSGREADYITGVAILIVTAAFFLGVWYGVRYMYQYLATQKPFPYDALSAVLVPSNETAPCPYQRLLDGICVMTEEAAAPPLVGVMIENSVEAWPLSGLAGARIVYEAPSEGNIPRFLAIYPSTETVVKAGPVRSARPYYLDWAKEYGNLMYMHVGGSPEALDRIAADKNFFDLNEFFRGWYFWRSTDRYAPHNTYTSNHLWEKAWSDYGDTIEDHTLTSWKFTTSSETCEEACVGTIRFSFGSPAYAVEWKYNTSTQTYDRYQAGKLQYDGDTVVTADTVVIQRVKAVVLDDVGRKKITTIGRGEAAVFRHGYVTEGFWEKEAIDQRTEWVDVKGQAISLQAGKIWIEVVPTYNEVEWALVESGN